MLKKLLSMAPYLMAALLVLMAVSILHPSHGAKPVSPPAETSRDQIWVMPGRIVAPPESVAPLLMKAYNVKVSVKDNVAVTTIEQTFVNQSKRTLEASYLYPLPADANYSTFSLTINGKVVEGKILEKDAARNTYYEIVRKFIDPGLLEYVDDKTVKGSIAPIFPGEEKRVSLSYTQLLKRDGGLYKYQYPFALKQTGSAMPIEKASVELSLKTQEPLKTIYSPTHSPKVDRNGAREANVTLNLKENNALLEKNFVLYFSEDNQAVSLNSLAFKEPNENGYFLMSVRAPQSLQTKAALPKTMMLVVDTSGSMSGEKIHQAKEALKYVINHLGPQDTFNITQFNTDVSVFRSEPMAATAENRRAALDYVETLRADGSTNIEGALKTAFNQFPKSSADKAADRPQYVIFLTDGEPTVGVTDTESLVKLSKTVNLSHAKLFNFGVGYDVNTTLLGKLADSNQGSTSYVEPNENLEIALASFYNKIEQPVLTDVKLDFGNLKVSRVYPENVGDLFVGSEVILLGRYEGGGPATVNLTGKVGDEMKRFAYPVEWDSRKAGEHGHLPRLWAARRIGYLLDNIHQNGENTETKNEVIALSKQFGIVTPYTSFLAMDSSEGEGRPVRALPAAASAVGSMANYNASKGSGAVQLQKSLKRMKDQSNAADLAAAQSAAPEAAAGASQPVLGIKTLAGKTFVLSKEGVWTDTAYDKKKHGEPTQVTFGTPEYFALLNQRADLARFFSLGQQVLVLLGDRAYEVVAAQKT